MHDRRTLWLLIYLLLLTGPMLVAFLPPKPDAAGWMWNFAMALGYLAAAMIGLQFLLTARFKRPSAPFGIDIIYYFHRWLALALLLLLALHVGLAVYLDPGAIGGNGRLHRPIALGAVAAGLLLVIAGASYGRKQLHLEYGRWRITHALLASAALVLTLTHVEASAQMLNSAGKRALWSAFAAFGLLLITYVRLLRPWHLRARPWRLLEVSPERGRSVTLRLQPVGHPGFAAAPGQFAWLWLQRSPFTLSEHPFSIAAGPEPDGTLSFTIKALGDFSAHVATLEPGARAYVDGPYGVFSCDRHPDARGLVFVAGGAGIAPLMAMLRALALRGDRRPIWLFYGNQAWERVVFREELASLAERLDLRVIHLLGEPPEDWPGERGLLRQDVLARHLPDRLEGLHAFICGPTPMIRIAERSLAALGMSHRHMHSELFDLV